MPFKTRLVVGVATLFVANAAFANLQHIVVFRYKADVSAAQKADIATRFLGLKDLARQHGHPYILAITGGKAISKEGFDQGLEQAFVVTFKNEADRNYFVGKPYSNEMDPAHQELAEIVVPLLAADGAGKLIGIFAFDFNDDSAVR